MTLSSFADVFILPDRDSDGLRDEWEERYGFDADMPGTGLHEDDMDGANNSKSMAPGAIHWTMEAG